MDANFAIARLDESVLELRSRRSTRLWVGLGCLSISGACFFGALTGRLHQSLGKGEIWRAGIIMCATALALYGFHALLNNKTIQVDRQRQRIEIQGRMLGVWSRRVTIPFRLVTGVQVLKRFDPDTSSPYWCVVLQGPGHFGGKGLDASSDEDYVERVAETLAKLVGCPLSRGEFSVDEARRKGSLDA